MVRGWNDGRLFARELIVSGTERELRRDRQLLVPGRSWRRVLLAHGSASRPRSRPNGRVDSCADPIPQLCEGDEHVPRLP